MCNDPQETLDLLWSLTTSPGAFTELYIKETAVSAIAEIARLKAENQEHEQLFSLQWKADQRGIKMWQEANPGNDLVWPDSAKLSVWLLEQFDKLKSTLNRHDYHARRVTRNLCEDGPEGNANNVWVANMLKTFMHPPSSDTPESPGGIDTNSDKPQNAFNNSVSGTDGDLDVSKQVRHPKCLGSYSSSPSETDDGFECGYPTKDSFHCGECKYGNSGGHKDPQSKVNQQE